MSGVSAAAGLPGRLAPVTATPVLGLVFTRTRVPGATPSDVPQTVYTVERLADALRGPAARRESVSSALSATEAW